MQHTLQKQFPCRILCLTETPRSLLIWAHYANPHTGFVCEFEVPPLPFRKFGTLRKVEYTDLRPTFDIDKGEMGVDQRVFTAKSPEWSYEKSFASSGQFGSALRKVKAPRPAILCLCQYSASNQSTLDVTATTPCVQVFKKPCRKLREGISHETRSPSFPTRVRGNQMRRQTSADLNANKH